MPDDTNSEPTPAGARKAAARVGTAEVAAQIAAEVAAKAAARSSAGSAGDAALEPADDRAPPALVEQLQAAAGETTAESKTTELKPGEPKSGEPKSGEPKPGDTLFGVLDADQRIRRSIEQHERTLWASALVFTLLYAALIATQAMGLAFTPAGELERQERERRGQDGPDSISVELVPEPDKNAKTKRWRDGTEQQTPAANDLPPQQAQQPQQAQPEVKEQEQVEDEKKPEEKEEKKGGDPKLDIEALVDAAAADLTEQIDRAYQRKPQKPQRQQEAALAGGGMKVRGSGASGKSDAFSRSVIAALMKTRPGPFALWGRVLVSFQIGDNGQLRYVRVVHSSGNTALDNAAVSAIRRARFQRPPPGLSADQRTYIIDYIFG